MFFSKFPKVDYKLLNGYTYNLTDFTRYANIDTNILKRHTLYQFYDIMDGERPDVVSTKLYRNPSYYWTFFLINDHLKNGYGSWPMSYSEMETFFENEYDGIAIQTTETFWEYDHVQLGSTFTIEGKESVTGIVHYINTDLNQIVLKNVTEKSQWLNSEGFNLVPSDYSTDTPRLTINLSTEYRYGISHYEDSNEKVIPITYGVNYNFSEETNGTVFEQTEILYPIRFDEKEIKMNDLRSKIRVIKPSQITNFYENFIDTINA